MSMSSMDKTLDSVYEISKTFITIPCSIVSFNNHFCMHRKCNNCKNLGKKLFLTEELNKIFWVITIFGMSVNSKQTIFKDGLNCTEN